jgi:RNA polymerase sigma-70 factor, ECF subfamily
MSEITSLLKDFSKGDREAEARLFELVYNDLHRMAGSRLRRERPHHTLQPSALVNEAYVKLSKARDFDWQDRAHFFAVAARCMRQILVDYARRRHPLRLQSPSVLSSLVDRNPEQVVEISRLLDELDNVDPRQCRVVELHFFGGFTFREIAGLLRLSERTIREDWAFARTWLHVHLTARADDHS